MTVKNAKVMAAAAAVAAGAGAVTTIVVRRRGARGLPTTRDGERATVRGVTVNRPPQAVYEFWRDLPGLAAALGRSVQVERVDEGRSRWRVAGPAGGTAWWSAEIVADQPGEVLAWRVEDGPAPHEGRAEFTAAPNDRGTELRVSLRYRMPGGAPAAAAHKLIGDDPDQVLRTALRRVKQLLECGQVVTVEGQPTGRGPLRERATRVVQRKLSTGGRP